MPFNLLLETCYAFLCLCVAGFEAVVDGLLHGTYWYLLVGTMQVKSCWDFS